MSNIDELLKNTQQWADDLKKPNTTIGGFDSMAFPTIMQSFPSLVIEDLISVQPMGGDPVMDLDATDNRYDYTKEYKKRLIKSTWKEVVDCFMNGRKKVYPRRGTSAGDIYHLNYVYGK